MAEFLDAFDGLWDALVPAERRELLHVLVHRVAVDTATGQLRIKLYDLKDHQPAGAIAAAEATP